MTCIGRGRQRLKLKAAPVGEERTSLPEGPGRNRRVLSANVLRHPPAGGCLPLDFAATTHRAATGLGLRKLQRHSSRGGAPRPSAAMFREQADFRSAARPQGHLPLAAALSGGRGGRLRFGAPVGRTEPIDIPPPAARTAPHSGHPAPSAAHACRWPRLCRRRAPGCGRPCARWRSGARSGPRCGRPTAP